jgi:hypothetical protein
MILFNVYFQAFIEASLAHTLVLYPLTPAATTQPAQHTTVTHPHWAHSTPQGVQDYSPTLHNCQMFRIHIHLSPVPHKESCHIE